MSMSHILLVRVTERHNAKILFCNTLNINVQQHFIWHYKLA